MRVYLCSIMDVSFTQTQQTSRNPSDPPYLGSQVGTGRPQRFPPSFFPLNRHLLPPHFILLFTSRMMPSLSSHLCVLTTAEPCNSHAASPSRRGEKRDGGRCLQSGCLPGARSQLCRVNDELMKVGRPHPARPQLWHKASQAAVNGCELSRGDYSLRAPLGDMWMRRRTNKIELSVLPALMDYLSRA